MLRGLSTLWPNYGKIHFWVGCLGCFYAAALFLALKWGSLQGIIYRNLKSPFNGYSLRCHLIPGIQTAGARSWALLKSHWRWAGKGRVPRSHQCSAGPGCRLVPSSLWRSTCSPACFWKNTHLNNSWSCLAYVEKTNLTQTIDLKCNYLDRGDRLVCYILTLSYIMLWQLFYFNEGKKMFKIC